MLLLFSLVSMSYILVNSMGNLMSKRWQALVVIVTAPDVEKALSHKANVKFRP
ncbi:MAG: hypothetical protein ISR65_04240 [Bacteriovoracaceae bacterium]|nr:hypothetical protein [Bacteriovoracaceae bacterium]